MSEENKDNQIEDVVSYNSNADIDFELDIPELPEPAPEEPSQDIEDNFDASFKFAFIGVGQGGSRVAETFHKMGYRKVCAINTAQQDLNTINLEDNRKLCIGEGGAGKNPKKAGLKFDERKDDVIDFMRKNFGKKMDRVFVCAGGGGGTGTGCAVRTAEAIKEMLSLSDIECTSKKIGLILTLPKISEGKKVCSNAAGALKVAYDAVKEGLISPLIVIDNEKINSLYPNLAVGKFWDTANRSIAGLFHLFNMTANKDSSFSSFDANDYRQVLDSGMLSFGASPVKEWKDTFAISKTVRDNLKNNLLTGGIDLSSANSAGVIVIGSNEILNELPQENLDHAFEQFSRMMKGNSTVHRGIYSGTKPTLTVYTCMGGFDSPEEKIGQLKKYASS